MLKNSIFERALAFTEPVELQRQGIYPFFREIISEQDTEVTMKNGRRVLMLGSNSYMGLTNHPEVKEAGSKAVAKYGTGCAGSRFLNGTLDIHRELEIELAAWVGKEAAMLYSTGFQVNQGVIAGLLGRHDYAVVDKLSHASIIDGAVLSRASVIRFPHNDMGKLARIMADLPAERGKLIISEGVFSMHGDVVKLKELTEVANEHSAMIMLDDAHSLGVLGPQGAGTAAEFGLTEEVDLIMGTFSKSLASIGGFVAGPETIIDYLRHRSRAFIFSASMPPSSAASALAALKIIQREPERIKKLWDNTHYMRKGLHDLGYYTGQSTTPVIPVYIGDMVSMLKMNNRLEEEGLFVNPVLPPAVPPTDTLIRISLMANHTRPQIDFALEKMDQVGREFDLI